MGTVTEPSAASTESPGPPVTNLAWLLSQASYVLATQMTAALEKVGISPRAYCVLSTAMTGEFTQIELAHAIGLDKTTMVVTIDELEAAGLAKRKQASDDRRAHIVAVTKAGERKVAHAEEIVDRVHSEVLAELPARDRKIFVGALTRLVGGPLSSASPCAKPVRRRAPR